MKTVPATVQVVAFAVLLSGLAGCTIGNGPELLRRHARPGEGEQISGEFWNEAAGHAGDSGFQSEAWLLPTWLDGRLTVVGDEGDRLASSEFSYFNLGLINLPWLPVWLSVDTQLDQQSGQQANSRTLWTPVWTHSSTRDWPADEPRLSAWGFPLVYGGLEYGRTGGEPEFSLHSTLYTVGPSWGWVDLADDDEGEFVRGWFAMPATALGLGPLLWSSTELETESGDVSVHGPLWGTLGYLQVDDREDGDRLRLLLGGALWLDTDERRSDGVVHDARHGPLWGMFGWGRWDGEPVLYLLWVPIGY
jgi:hypothetical protein